MQTVTAPNSPSALRAFQSVFASSEWLINIVWLTLAALANSIFVGQIALFGWGTELLEKRVGRVDAQPHEMNINSDRLGDYITKGIWPFLVQLLVPFAISFIVIMPLAFIMVLVMAALGAAAGDAGAAIGSIFLFVVMFVAIIAASLATVPFLIHAMVSQDFQTAFDLGWAREFLGIMFVDMLKSGVAFSLLAFVTLILGALALCVGYLPATGIIMGASMNLISQWYEVYLSRGGRPATPPANQVIDATIV